MTLESENRGWRIDFTWWGTSPGGDTVNHRVATGDAPVCVGLLLHFDQIVTALFVAVDEKAAPVNMPDWNGIASVILTEAGADRAQTQRFAKHLRRNVAPGALAHGTVSPAVRATLQSRLSRERWPTPMWDLTLGNPRGVQFRTLDVPTGDGEQPARVEPSKLSYDLMDRLRQNGATILGQPAKAIQNELRFHTHQGEPLNAASRLRFLDEPEFPHVVAEVGILSEDLDELTDLGDRFTAASSTTYKRATAEAQVRAMVNRAIAINEDPHAQITITKLFVFGSILGRSETVGDVDVGIWWEIRDPLKSELSDLSKRLSASLKNMMEPGNVFLTSAERDRLSDLRKQENRIVSQAMGHLKQGSRILNIKIFVECPEGAYTGEAASAHYIYDGTVVPARPAFVPNTHFGKHTPPPGLRI